MSDLVNQTIYENAREALDLAKSHSEYWVGTTWEDMFDLRSKAVVTDVQNNNLEDLYNVSLPRLEELFKESMKEMFLREYTLEPDYEN